MNRYLVIAFGGSYEDAWEFPVLVVESEERAKEVVERLQEESDQYDREMTHYQDNPQDVPGHLYDTEYMGEVECSLECKACDIERYWPDMHYTTYRYTVVDSEV